ncbi:MAG: polyphenol oxidase family protein [Actinomycetota bacterium]|nr:polyphenol oxidase family protein [Actinomycetota bacterium]
MGHPESHDDVTVPALPAPFRWEGDLVAADLGDHHIRFTTRRGGVSRPPYDSLNLGRWTQDDPASVSFNYAKLAETLRVDFARLAMGLQVHGNEVQRRDEEPDFEEQLLACDGQATHVEGVTCLVLTADCLPVALLCDGAVAMVHAGWRGLDGGVLDDGLRALRELGGRGAVIALIGPGASGECYEVGDDLRARFETTSRTLDLKALAAERLRAGGVAEVHDVGLCTMCGREATYPLFFSHRRDGPLTGRQAGLAWLS